MPLKPLFFSNAPEWRRWLLENHKTAKEVVVGFWKVDTGRPTMTWSESVDEALCFGWIDGIRKSMDGDSYCIRFTPRSPRSHWSAINLEKVRQLKERGLMTEVGLAIFEARDPKKEQRSPLEQKRAAWPPGTTKRFQSEPAAWSFFSKQAPSYQKRILWWIVSAKKDEARERRLQKLIATSRDGKRLF